MKVRPTSEQKRMNVAVIDGDVSYPANSGKRLRTLNLLLQAARRHRVFYVGRCSAGSEEDRLAPSYLRQHGIEPVLVHHPVPRKAGALFYARLLANQFSSLPYSVTSHTSEPMRRAVSELARRERIDVWQVEWAPYLQTIDAAIPGPRVVGAHNVDTVIWRRYYETETHPLKKALLRTQWRRFHRFEDTAFRRATRVVAVTEADAQQIREHFGQPHVDVVENGIDRAFFGPSSVDATRLASSSSGRSTGGRTGMPSGCCWTRSSRGCGPSSPTPSLSSWGAIRPSN